MIPPPTSPSTTRSPWPGCWTACGEAGAQEQAAALADRAAAHVALDDPDAVARLLDSLREAGAEQQAAALLARDPPPTSPSTTRAPWPGCWTACGRRARSSRPPRCWPVIPPPTSALDDPGAVARLLDSLREAGAQEQAAALADRAAAHVPLDDPVAVAWLLDSLREAGAQEQAAALADRAAAHVPLDDPGAVARLLDSLRRAGAQEQVTALAGP